VVNTSPNNEGSLDAWGLVGFLGGIHMCEPHFFTSSCLHFVVVAVSAERELGLHTSHLSYLV